MQPAWHFDRLSAAGKNVFIISGRLDTHGCPKKHLSTRKILTVATDLCSYVERAATGFDQQDPPPSLLGHGKIHLPCNRLHFPVAQAPPVRDNPRRIA